jgi:hypothetical protein
VSGLVQRARSSQISQRHDLLGILPQITGRSASPLLDVSRDVGSGSALADCGKRVPGTAEQSLTGCPPIRRMFCIG